MTGAFLRVKRDIHYKVIEVEYLTNEEREEIFKGKDSEELLSWLNLVCNALRDYENYIEGRDL